MSSALTSTLVLLALSGTLFQSAARARNNAPTWTNSRSLDSEGYGPPSKSKFTEMTCDHFASCAADVNHENTCFCDRVCRIYADCCPDYVDEEGDQLTPLPPRIFTCSEMYSDHFYFITECPTTYDVQFVREGCRLGSASAQRQSSERFYAVPVSGRTSGLVYRNIYCAVCHGEESVDFWNVTTRNCDEPRSSEQVTLEPESAGDPLLRESFISRCLVLFSPASDVPPPRRCVSNIASCPDHADAELMSRCERSSNVAYIYDRMDGQAYRSRDCAACNGHADYDLSCNSSRETADRNIGTSNAESFSIILDLNTGKGSAIRAGSSRSVTQRLGSCPDRHVYDPFASTCRAIACPPGHSFAESGQCRRHQFEITSEAGHKRSGFRYRSDDPDCSWIQINRSEYQMLSNRSIYIPLHDATYDADSYLLDNNQTAFVCTPFQRNYTEWVHKALEVDAVGIYLSRICSVISLLALAFQFAVYMAFPVLHNTPGRCIISLVASLFVGQLLFLLVKTGSSVSPGYCFGQAALMHFAYMAAFLWMNVMAVDVYRTFGASPGAAALSSSPAGARRRFCGYSAYAWVTAALIVAVGVGLDLADVGDTYRPHYGHRVCWFGSRGGLLLLFGLPVGVLLAANIIMFALSVRHIRSASKASQMAAQKTDQTPLVVSNVMTVKRFKSLPLFISTRHFVCFFFISLTFIFLKVILRQRFPILARTVKIGF